MFESIKKIIGESPSVDYALLVKQGGIILDVRTNGEYAGGHIKGSINIPLDQLKVNLYRMADPGQPIITCCASGLRSAAAKDILESSGYRNVHNGGSWTGLSNKI